MTVASFHVLLTKANIFFRSQGIYFQSGLVPGWPNPTCQGLGDDEAV